MGLENTYDLDLFVAEEPVGAGNDLVISVHSPVLVSLTDDEGKQTGIFPLPDSDLYYTQEDIPGSSVQFGGEGKYIFVPGEGRYEVSVEGIGTGTFAIEIEETEDDAFMAIANIPVTPDTKAFLAIENGLENTSPLVLDKEGDGEEDASILFQENETIIYQEEVSTESEEAESSSGGGSSHGKDTPDYKEEIIVAQSQPSAWPNPYLLPPSPFVPITEQQIGDVSEDGLATVSEGTSMQTASVYNAFQNVIKWLLNAWSTFWQWISNFI